MVARRSLAPAATPATAADALKQAWNAPAINTQTRHDGDSLRKLLHDGIRSDGRMVDRIMPRIEIEVPLAQALARLLPMLRERDAPGVESDRIQILVASSGTAILA